MNAGDLDRQIAIFRPSTMAVPTTFAMPIVFRWQRAAVPDPTGQPATWTWIFYAQAWAQFVDLTGTELYKAQQWDAKTNAKFRIRWLPGISTKFIIAWDGRMWDLTAVLELGRRVGLDCYGYARSE